MSETSQPDDFREQLLNAIRWLEHDLHEHSIGHLIEPTYRTVARLEETLRLLRRVEHEELDASQLRLESLRQRIARLKSEERRLWIERSIAEQDLKVIETVHRAIQAHENRVSTASPSDHEGRMI